MAKNVKKNVAEKNTVKVVRGKRDLSDINPEYTDAFIQEVDEDVKNDNLKALWNRYGLLIVAIVAIAVTAAVSFDKIREWRAVQNQRNTESYMAASQLNKENPEQTLAALQQISQNNQGIFSDFARLQIANILLEQEKTEEGLAALENILQDNQVNSEVKNVALVKLATYRLDTMDREQFENLLKPLLEGESSWKPMAQDLLAMSAIKSGDIETAKTIYEQVLKVKDLPESFRIKVQDMLSSISDM